MSEIQLAQLDWIHLMINNLTFASEFRILFLQQMVDDWLIPNFKTYPKYVHWYEY